MSSQPSRAQLKKLILEHSVRHGEFNLASGLSTGVYIDGKLTTCRADGTKLVGRVFLEKIAELGWRPAAVGGLTMGADPIVIAIARESNEPPYGPIDAFLVRKEPKKHGLQKFIEGIESTRDLPVVIIDDVCTTGGSTAIAIQYARDAGMNVIGALCLVDREMGAASKLTKDLNCPFEGIFTLGELLAAEDQSALEPASASAA